MYAREQAVIATLIGWIVVTGTDAVARVAIGVDAVAPQPGAGEAAEAARQMAEFFAGTRQTFDLRLAALPTARGEELRAAMIAVGYGETVRYGALAHRVGSGARAIGQACARNPIPILVPCHRILSASGPGNYSAGRGLETKTWLLDHERRVTGEA